MRILLTVAPGAGHLFPLVPLAWALRALGHEIVLATAGQGTVLGPGAGLTTVDVAPDVDMSELIAATSGGAGGSARTGLPREQAIALFTTISREMLDGTRRWCWTLVARRRDLREHARRRRGGRCRARYPGRRARDRLGGPARGAGICDVACLDRWSPLCPDDRRHRCRSAELGACAESRLVDAPGEYTGGAVVPADVLAAPRQPRVLVTMGSVVPRTGGIELGRTGRRTRSGVDRSAGCTQQGPRRTRPAAGVGARTPMRAVDRRASAVRRSRAPPRRGRHLPGRAGSRSTQIILPQGADQFLNADSLVTRGCALRAAAEPDELRSALRAALSGPLWTARSRKFAGRSREMPPAPIVADALLTLLSR